MYVKNRLPLCIVGPTTTVRDSLCSARSISTALNRCSCRRGLDKIIYYTHPAFFLRACLPRPSPVWPVSYVYNISTFQCVIDTHARMCILYAFILCTTCDVPSSQQLYTRYVQGVLRGFLRYCLTMYDTDGFEIFSQTVQNSK